MGPRPNAIITFSVQSWGMDSLFGKFSRFKVDPRASVSFGTKDLIAQGYTELNHMGVLSVIWESERDPR